MSLMTIHENDEKQEALLRASLAMAVSASISDLEVRGIWEGSSTSKVPLSKVPT